MLAAASLLLKLVYVLLPAVSMLAFVRKCRRSLRATITGAWGAGIILGACLAGGYAMAMGGTASIFQVLLTCYFGVALMLLMKAFDRVILIAVRRLLLRRSHSTWRLGAALLLRTALSAVIIIPWAMAAVMVYRPRIRIPENAGDVLHVPCQDVRFAAADGSRVAGWYLPAADSTTTALLCHGLGSSRAGWLAMIQQLNRSGVNVLAIDLRAHGESGGQLCTFGAGEALDVLGAVNWLKTDRAGGSERIVGVGASLGSAALLQAAAQDDRIDAVASLSTFDTVPNELAAVTRARLPGPLGWLTRTVALPLASLHCGVDLASQRPIDSVGRLWPRPVLIVHGTDDEIIPFSAGMKLFAAATLPKQSLWIQNGSHNGLLQDKDVLRAVERFVKNSARSPVI